MAGTDYVRHSHQIAYDPPASPAEKALTESVTLCAINGPVNFTWNQSTGDITKYIWPDD